MPFTSRPPTGRSRQLIEPPGPFSVGRRGVLWNGQQARNSRPGEVKWEGKRSTLPMANHISGMRPGPNQIGALGPALALSRNRVVTRLEAALSHPKGGQP